MEGVMAEIRGFGGNFAPRNWAFCNGQLLSIAQNQALFSLLGTTYGGDGRTTFALPDLRGRSPISEGTGPGLTPRPLGQRSGQEWVQLNSLQIPSHTHTATTSITGGTGSIAGTAKGKLHLANDETGATDGDNAYMGNNAGTEIYGTPATSNYSAADSVIIDDFTGLTVDLTAVSASTTVSPSGGSQQHTNMQPYLVIHWVICLQGLFPSRS